MKLQLENLTNYSVSIFKNKFDAFVSPLKHKILVVALVVFSCLAAIYVASRYCFKPLAPQILRGNAKLKFRDGPVFNGDLDLKNFEGEGVIKKKNGSSVTGFFIVDARKGVKIAVPDRPASKLQLKEEWDGEARVEFSDGSIFEGEFKNSELNGQGTIIDDFGVIREGEFKHGRLDGKGKIEGPFGVHEGIFRRGDLHGQGKITYPNGMIKEGEFEDGRLNGKGKIEGPAGLVREGIFKRDDLHGQGKITYPNGMIKEGEFEDGELKGPGRITYPDGMIKEGEFKDGFFTPQRKSDPLNGTNEEGIIYHDEV